MKKAKNFKYLRIYEVKKNVFEENVLYLHPKKEKADYECTDRKVVEGSARQ